MPAPQKISAAHVSRVLAAAGHPRASETTAYPLVSGFVVTTEGGRVCITYQEYGSHRSERWFERLFTRYAETLAAAGYTTEPWRNYRVQLGLLVAGKGKRR